MVPRTSDKGFANVSISIVKTYISQVLVGNFGKPELDLKEFYYSKSGT